MNQCMNLHGVGIILVCNTMSSNVGSFGTDFQFHVLLKKIVYNQVVNMHMEISEMKALKMNLVHQTVFSLEKTDSGHWHNIPIFFWGGGRSAIVLCHYSVTSSNIALSWKAKFTAVRYVLIINHAISLVLATFWLCAEALLYIYIDYWSNTKIKQIIIRPIGQVYIHLTHTSNSRDITTTLA